MVKDLIIWSLGDTVMEIRNFENVVKKKDIEKINQDNSQLNKKIILSNFKEVADLFLKKKEILLFNSLFSHVHLVSFEEGKIVLHPTEDSPKDLASKVGTLLTEWTNNKWHILMTQKKGEDTLEEQDDKEKNKIIDEMKQNNKVKEILNFFPGAKIEEIKDKGDKNE